MFNAITFIQRKITELNVAPQMIEEGILENTEHFMF